MKNNLWKNEFNIIFRCLVRALWICSKSPIEIMQIRYVLADFELSYFFQNKNWLELLNIIFENDSPKGSFWANKKKVEFLLLSPDSRKLLTTCIKSSSLLFESRDIISIFLISLFSVRTVSYGYLVFTCVSCLTINPSGKKLGVYLTVWHSNLVRKSWQEISAHESLWNASKPWFPKWKPISTLLKCMVG